MSDATCKVDECAKPAKNAGMCWGHYCRKRRRGDASAPALRSNEPAEVRWLTKVRVESPGCWVWTDAPNSSGYGTLSVENKATMAHRFVWEHLVGPIPPGMELDHLCKVRLCVNPDHLEPVEPSVNNLRSGSPAAVAARRDACARGHRYTSESTRIHPTGYRMCLECVRINSQNRRKVAADV